MRAYRNWLEARKLAGNGLVQPMATKTKSESQPTSFASNLEGATDGIATELRLAREAKGYSFADLHRETGLSRTTLHQYEAGTRKPGSRELLALCKALEVSPNRVIFGTEEPFATASGVLVPLAKLARTDPNRALSQAALIMPLVAAILASIGDNTLMGLATLADEALRARDPENFTRLSKLLAEFDGINPDTLVGKSKEELEQFAANLFESAGMPAGNSDST